MSKLWATFRGFGALVQIFLFTGFAVFLLGFFTVVVGYFYFSRDLPRIQKVGDYHPQLVTEVFGSDGTKIGEFWKDGRRETALIAEVPHLLRDAFIAAEDSRFFEHRGIDFRGMLRALIENWKAGEIVQGGSTITQQVTRSLLLSRTRSYERKIREIILSNRLERHLKKEQILYLYLNEIYLGNRAYGVKAAAHNYFRKNLEQLNLAEMALLAGLPRAPEYYSPLKSQTRARERQRYVLNRLFEENKIGEQELLTALSTSLRIYRQGTDKEINLGVAPHFMEYLRQQLLDQFGEEVLYRGGLKVETTIDPSLQKAAKEALQRGLEVVDRRRSRWRGTLKQIPAEEIPAAREKRHQSILKTEVEYLLFPNPGKDLFPKTPIRPGEIYEAIVLDFEKGKTKVAVGRFEGVIPDKDISFDPESLSYGNHYYMQHPQSVLKTGDLIRVRYHGEERFSFYQPPLLEGAVFAQEPATGFARAMVGGYDFRRSEFNRAMSALRQPGSSFKPIVYAAALDKGYTMNTTVIDTPFAIPVGDEIWSPKNSSGEYRGAVPLKQALAYSYNLATARVAYHIGFDYIAAYARKMGVSSELQVIPAMALGANGVPLYEMVRAYAVFPNLGKFRPTQFVTRITDQSGALLYSHEKPETTPLATLQKTMIEQDKFNLSENELAILFDDRIPEDHVMTPQTATLMTQLLREVTRVGSGAAVAKLKRPVAGKTGTTNGNTDAWFVGFTPDLAAGVWVGYDQMKSIGKGEQGGTVAAPIFLDFLQQASRDKPVVEFAVPEDLENRDIALLKGGSAEGALLGPFPTLGENYQTAGTSQDRAADFLGADLEALDVHADPAHPDTAVEQVDMLDR